MDVAQKKSGRGGQRQRIPWHGELALGNSQGQGIGPFQHWATAFLGTDSGGGLLQVIKMMHHFMETA